MNVNLGEKKEEVPAWIGSLLGRRFFGVCGEHDENPKNELNIYCITCDIEMCKYCVTTKNTHISHNLLKIYRHVYQDVVLLQEMENHIDCSKIQPYKCNKKWIIAMNPLPHCGSGAQIDADLSCLVCKRKLMNPEHYRYCSIACKIETLPKKKQDQESSSSPSASASASVRRMLLMEAQNSSSRTMEMEMEIEEAAEKRKRRRKGIPIKAPLF